jgi:AraC-like DNA-binding protein
VGVLREVPRVLRALGADPESVFQVVGLNLHILDNPENEISFVAMGQLLDACVEATRCEHFGLMAGQGSHVPSLGVVGQLMQTAPTLEFALWDLVLNQARNVDGAVCYLRQMGELSALCYAIYQPNTPAIDQIYDRVMALAYNSIQELAGCVAVEVTFCHAEPRDMRPFRRFFGVPLTFDAEESAVVFPSQALSLPVCTGCAERRSYLQDLVRTHSALSDPEITSQVIRLLRPRVISGRPTLGEVAGYFSLHPRALLRKLKERGTTFRDLLNETRFEVACQLLRSTRLSITQIGMAFGYADTAVFTRAFERWSGLAPSEWRAHHAAPRSEDLRISGRVRDRPEAHGHAASRLHASAVPVTKGQAGHRAKRYAERPRAALRKRDMAGAEYGTWRWLRTESSIGSIKT